MPVDVIPFLEELFNGDVRDALALKYPNVEFGDPFFAPGNAFDHYLTLGPADYGTSQETEVPNQKNCWVVGQTLTEPRIVAFSANSRLYSVIVIDIHVPPNNYHVLLDIDKHILRALKASGRFINSTRVTDFTGISRSHERERTLLIR